MDDAVAILKLTMEEYPRSANVYGSSGDALLAQGDTANALANFKKCFAMDGTMTAIGEDRWDRGGRSARVKVKSEDHG